MRGCDCSASEAKAFVLLDIIGILYDCGDDCCSSLLGDTVLSKKQTLGSERYPTLENCARLQFRHAHDGLTNRLFLSIALQCIDILKAERKASLCFKEQIQFYINATQPIVQLDLAYPEYCTHLTQAQDSDDDSNYENRRVRCAMGALLDLFVDGRVIQDKKYLLEDGVIVNDYSPQGSNVTLARATLRSLTHPDFATFGGFRSRLLMFYKILDDTEGYANQFWKGICRPMLDRAPTDQISCAWCSGTLCECCKPGPIVSFPIKGNVAENYGPHPAVYQIPGPKHRCPQAPLRKRIETCYWDHEGNWRVYKNWNPAPRAWAKEARATFKPIMRLANDQGTKVFFLPTKAIWKTQEPRRSEDVQEALDEHIARWRVINLRHLINAFRLAPDLVATLESQAAERLQLAGELEPGAIGCYIGCYDQVYVVLVFDPEMTVDAAAMDAAGKLNSSKLSILLSPFCLKASSPTDAQRKTVAFWNTVRLDAGCTDYATYGARLP